MVFGLFSRRQYPLPKFPATIRPAFEQACETIPPEKLPELRTSLEECLAEVLQRCDENPRMRKKLVEQIGERARWLLENYERYSPMQQALIIGAIRYFTASEDPVSDEGFATGFNDDAAVFNYVLEELGATDQYIDVHR